MEALDSWVKDLLTKSAGHSEGPKLNFLYGLGFRV